jgi:hypothetical protein
LYLEPRFELTSDFLPEPLARIRRMALGAAALPPTRLLLLLGIAALCLEDRTTP